jgi:rubrerythrin
MRRATRNYTAAAGHGRPRADVLDAPKRPTGPFAATCDKCRAARQTLDAASFDEARRALRQLGWLEAAQKGKGVKRWHWWCPACKPPSSAGSRGPSVGAMPKP